MSKQTEKQKPSEGNPPEEPKNKLALMKRGVVDAVTERVERMVEQGELAMPPGYAIGNAVTSWWLKLQSTEDRNKKAALEVCTRDSIANATLDMLVQGLNPAKGQCYPIVYGDQLVCQRGYIGSIAVVKYIYGQGTRVWAEAVYAEDELEYEIIRGRKMVTNHKQSLKNVDNAKIVAAYAIIEPEEEGVEPVCEIMTIAKIKRAWQQGQTKGSSPAHQGFPDEMAKKTVINRACKLLIAASDDSHLVAKHAKRQDQVIAEAEMAAEMDEQADGELLALEGDGNPESDEDGEVIDLTPGEEEFEAAMGEQEEAAEDKGGKGAQASLDTDPGF